MSTTASTPIPVPPRAVPPMSQRSFRHNTSKSLDASLCVSPKTAATAPSTVFNSQSADPKLLPTSLQHQPPPPQQDFPYTNTFQSHNSRSNVIPSSLFKCGWLYKRGKRKTWSKRWFVLRETQLIYYKDEREYKPKGIIQTEDIMAVAILTNEHKPNHFAFFTPSKSYHLRADSISEANSWVQELRIAVDTAATNALSSSFKRLGILESATALETVKSKFTNSSFNPSRRSFQLQGINNNNNNNISSNHNNHNHNHHNSNTNNIQHQKHPSNKHIPAVTIQTSSTSRHASIPVASSSQPPTFTNSFANAKRHSINTLDVSKIPKGVPGYNNGIPVETALPNFSLRLDGSVCSSKLSKSFGSTTSPGSSRSDYFSPSILTSTDDVRSSLSSQIDPLDDSEAKVKATSPLSPNNNSIVMHDEKAVVDPKEADLPKKRQSSEVNMADESEIQEALEEPAELSSNMHQLSTMIINKDSEDIVDMGWLIKRKKKMNQWRKVWVILTSRRLLIYKNEPIKSIKVQPPHKELDVQNIIDVMELDPISRSKKYCFQIITPERRIQFATAGEEDLIRWIAAIKCVIDGLDPNGV